MTLILAVLLACSGEPAPSAPAEPQPSEISRDQDQQHPPLPADLPMWTWDAGGFVGDHGWYGEHSWDDVRMRVAGHISVAGRDKARLLAEGGDWSGCAAAYRDLAERLRAIPARGGVSAQIHALLVAAAERDAGVCSALAEGRAPVVAEGRLAPLRARYLALAMGEGDAASLQRDLEPLLTVDETLAIDSFEDFDSRHRLRVRLFDAYLDALDPIGLDERWGYWEAVEVRRQALILGISAGMLGGSPWSGAELGPLPSVEHVDPLRRPSVLAARLHSPDQEPDFTALGLGMLPTGDSLIDVGSQPGPLAIGHLERLGTDDAEHMAWLAERADVLDRELHQDPEAVVSTVREMASKLDAYGHGSRYYNIKQVRNEGVRQLARAGRADLALDLLGDNLPLHNQDWACPNRQGILLALEGRLLAEADRRDEAMDHLGASLAASAAFLRNVDAAEAGRQVGVRPPSGR